MKARAPSSFSRASAWEKVPEGRMRAAARMRGGGTAAEHGCSCHPRRAGAGPHPARCATFSRKREKEGTRA
jgi:hypothetical protein